MYARTYGATTLGIDGIIIDVEVDVSKGFPGFEMVGLPNAMVREAKERVRTAIKNSGLKITSEKITVNLAPADIKKDTSGLDLPLAIALLAAYELIPVKKLSDCLFVGELSLEGECRSVPGILSMAISAREKGLKNMFVASDNVNEALLVEGLNIYSVPRLIDVVNFLNGNQPMEKAIKQDLSEITQVTDKATADIAADSSLPIDDFADVQGQFLAKRAFEIAAAGGHNVILVGSPGAGKTMLARRMPSILPEMTQEEALEVTKIYSIAGMLKHNSGLITTRPFRSPHHTASAPALIGGGSIPKPGEVTLSHSGVLFLDELPEFNKASLEALRQPLEDGQVTISRVTANLTFPSQIILIASMNPCPCGYNGDPERECTCNVGEINRYSQKLSGPLLDRIDIHIRVPRVTYKELNSSQKSESSAEIRKRVTAARKLQLKRFNKYGIFCNSQMTHAMLKRLCKLTLEAQSLLELAFTTKHLSARSYDRIIKVAQTIADLAASKEITQQHIAEAIQLRNDLQLNAN